MFIIYKNVFGSVFVVVLFCSSLSACMCDVRVSRPLCCVVEIVYNSVSQSASRCGHLLYTYSFSFIVIVSLRLNVR